MALYPSITQPALSLLDQQHALANEVAATRARADALECNHQAAVRQLEQQSAALEQHGARCRNLKCQVLYELVPIVVAAQLWGNLWCCLNVQFACDNAAVVAVLNK